MKRKTTVFILFFFAFTKVFSQTQGTNEVKPEDPKYELHQFYLTEPGIQILDIKYDKDCTPVKGTLSEDGKTVLVKEYVEHSRIYFKYLKADGKVEEISKSPCFIDPVVPFL